MAESLTQEDQCKLHEIYYNKDLQKFSDQRAQEEWFYALFYCYAKYGMQTDFKSISSTIANFYFGANLETDFRQADKTMSQVYATDQKIVEPQYKKGRDVPKRERDVEYILSTLNICASTIFSTDNGQTKEFTLPHKFFILIAIGHEEGIRKAILENHEKQHFSNPARKLEVTEKIQNLFKFCIQRHNVTVTNSAMNYFRSINIIKKFIKDAIMVYEGLHPPSYFE